MLSRAVSLCAFLALLVCPSFAQGKRPLNHRDYDAWRTLGGQKLSPDGKFLAYAVFPQEGDGEVIVRNLGTGKESKFPAGVRPAPVAGSEETPTPEARPATILFSANSRTLVFSTFPAKAATDQAKKDKKTPEQMPKDGMVIVDLASGQSATVARVKRFSLPENASAYLAYLKEAPEPATPAPAATEAGNGDSDQQGGRGGRGGAGRGGARSEFGTDLVLRNLTDASERTFADAAEFSFTDDGKQLVWAAAAHDAEKNGVYVARPGASDAPTALLAGKGKYQKLTWDEKQTALVFLSSHDDAAAKQPQWKLYAWDRKTAQAVPIVSNETAGFHSGYAISDKGALSFSKDGSVLYFGSAVPTPEKAAAATDDKAVVDVWTYKDDYIQSIQKVRATRDRDRTYTVAYSLTAHKLVQLGDKDLETVTPSENPQWALGSDDRAYRRMQDYDERFSDTYIVDASTGARKLAVKKARGQIAWSPGGRYLLSFDGKDWSTLAVADGKTVNLTAALPVKFWNEGTDTPSTPPAYGPATWTKDGKWVLLADEFDVWRVAPDGSGATNLTAGYGRAHRLRLRPVRTENDPRERWLDASKPLLLQAENLDTWESGFYRGSFSGGEPTKLVLENKSFSLPVKAKDADVYLLTRQSFDEFPDLLVTDGSFHELRKVSDVNPQKSGFVWGTSEVVRYKNADGVALTAALYKPENFDPKKQYPMIVYIYEKLTQNVNHFVNPAPGHSINMAYYVSNGYLVLTPDIVYTVGYPGQSALKCVLPAVQAVVDKGFVNEKAIGIQGHSWGGYQIAYMVTQTNRFRAAEAGAPVSNMISAYDGIRWGTGIPRQFQYEHTQSRIGGSIWQYPTRFIENSPIFWADRVETPLMILQNDADDAVPWYQGLEYFLALRRLGKEVYLFNYNGEPHHINKRPNQKDYTIRMQQFFDHYLKGGPAPEWMEKGVPYLERERTELERLTGGQ